jgi:nitrite reductase/ring-hydroxylating ferredoxin subunit
MAPQTTKIIGEPLPRCTGTTVRDLALADTNTVPEFLYEDNYENLGSDPVPAARYVDPAFFELEKQKMWPRVWQFAAREEDMPEPGDYVVYENVGRSFILSRQTDGSVRAFANVCLHRGRKLKTEDGWAAELQCPFHGFTWNMDGSLKQIPCRWDFPHLDSEEMKLPEISVGRWRNISRPCPSISSAGGRKNARPWCGSARWSPPTGKSSWKLSWKAGTPW